jgi:hypothetical protein
MMVTGQLPFQSNGPLDAWMKKINNEIDAPIKVVPTLSERIDWAIRRAISPEPQHRPESCAEFVEDLTGHSTKQLAGTDPALRASNEYWYLVYTDEAAVVHSVKGTIKGIRRSLVDGLLGDAENIRVARTKAGPFEPLKRHAEFRDLVIQPEKVATPKSAAADPKTLQPRTKPGSAEDTAAIQASADSTILENTSLGIPAVQAGPAKPKTMVPAGPQIQLADRGVSWAPELGRLAMLLFVFGGIGIFATYALPTLIRYIRFM